VSLRLMMLGGSAQLIGMLPEIRVSAGWAGKAAARMSGRLRAGGFDEAMAAALAAQDVLAAGETPVNVPDKAPPPAPAEDAGEADPEEQVFLFTRDFAVDWTDNVSERGAEAAKRHQAVSGYWHSLAPPLPLVPHPQLPRLRRRPRHHRTM
jgi:hypothetical protein